MVLFVAVLQKDVVRVDAEHFLTVLVPVLVLWLSLHLILVFFEAELVIGFELFVGLELAQLHFVVVGTAFLEVDEVHEGVGCA